MTLDRLLRRATRPRPYYPFSEPRWRGTIPLGSAKRGIFHTSNSYSHVFRPYVLSQLSSPSRQSKLSLYQDRRFWHPLGSNRPMVSKSESYPQMLDLPPDMAPRYPPNWERIHRPMERHLRHLKIKEKMKPGHIAWENPEKMIICLERRMRKEVLHALGIAGRGGNSRVHNWTQYSRVRCF